MNSVRTALCIGHPGHELRVLHWVSLCKPLTFVLTDGSGSNRPPRIATTARLLEQAGARPGRIFASFTDRDFFDLVLAGDSLPFIDLARSLAAEWHQEHIELVAGDMLEGFNVAHDLCRMLINAAVEHCSRMHQWGITNYEFALEASAASREDERAIKIALDNDTFQKKRYLCESMYPELKGEIARVIASSGEISLRSESLLPATVPAGLEWNRNTPPYYETYGIRQIAAGHYQRLITYREHMRPLAHALWDWAVSGRS